MEKLKRKYFILIIIPVLCCIYILLRPVTNQLIDTQSEKLHDEPVKGVAIGSKERAELNKLKERRTELWSGTSNVTVVTAYFDIGAFYKDVQNVLREPEAYFKWSKIFRHIFNPLVVYTDSEKFLRVMQEHRANFSDRTKFILVDRNSTWAFSKLGETQRIFKLEQYPGYIRKNPKAASYSCVQHAKYEVTAKAVRENYFNTKYFTWLDIGLFRHYVENAADFVLEIPSGWNQSRIAVDHVHPVSLNRRFSDIFLKRGIWICGCIFVGTRELILRYTDQYKRSIEYFMSRDLMDTDEQVVYAIYSKQGMQEIKPTVELQLYKGPTRETVDIWFHLGYIMRKFV